MGEQRAFICALGMMIDGGLVSVSWQEQGVLLSAIRTLCLHMRGAAVLQSLLCSEVGGQPGSLLPCPGLSTVPAPSTLHLKQLSANTQK